jgi:hypothetical protein
MTKLGIKSNCITSSKCKKLCEEGKCKCCCAHLEKFGGLTVTPEEYEEMKNYYGRVITHVSLYTTESQYVDGKYFYKIKGNCPCFDYKKGCVLPIDKRPLDCLFYPFHPYEIEVDGEKKLSLILFASECPLAKTEIINIKKYQDLLDYVVKKKLW